MYTIRGAVLIKPHDRTTDVEELGALARRADVAEETRSWIERELRIARRGRRGERDAEHEIEFHFGRRPDVATIHGLRIEHDGRAAQIDHLIVTRYLDVWVCESKAFTGRVEINDYGEWQVVYGHKSYGVKSPVVQAWNHLNVLADVLRARVAPPKVDGQALTPRFKVAVLFSDRARITRPAPGAEHLDAELSVVMKVERLYATLERVLRSEQSSHRAAISCEDLVEFAGKIAALHQPQSIDWLQKFGVSTIEQHGTLEPSVPTRDAIVIDITTSRCAACAVRLRPGEINYCRDKSAAFGGRLYCYRCQRIARATS